MFAWAQMALSLGASWPQFKLPWAPPGLHLGLVGSNLGSTWPSWPQFWVAQALLGPTLVSLGRLCEQIARLSFALPLAFCIPLCSALRPCSLLSLVGWVGTLCCTSCIALVDGSAPHTLCQQLCLTAHLVLNWLLEVPFPRNAYNYVVLCICVFQGILSCIGCLHYLSHTVLYNLWCYGYWPSFLFMLIWYMFIWISKGAL